MAKRILERSWNKKYELCNHPVIKGVFDDIREDIRAGCVFPALREKEIHLYHEGGRILRITAMSAKSNSAYYSKDKENKEVPIEKPLTKSKYDQIKRECREFNCGRLASGKQEYKELWIVSRLFKRFSIWSSVADPVQPKLIDVEVRIRDFQADTWRKIDLLFLDDAKRLTFVEVKRQYDVRARSPRNFPEVVCQIKKYENLLKNDADIRIAYSEVGRILSQAFGLEGFEPPQHIFPRVPLLICRNNETNEHEHAEWLNERLAICAEGKIHSDLVIDGGAIDECVYKNTDPLDWCLKGTWKNLDLNMVFQKIHCREKVSSIEGTA